jgi:hypothetical protein
MSEAHDTGSTVIVVTPGAEASGATEDGGQVEAVDAAEPLAEAIEETSSDAVEIARIEADRDVTVAAIHAETAEKLIEDAHATELEQCRTEIARLEERCTGLQTELSLLTPPPSEQSPPSPSGEAETVHVEASGDGSEAVVEVEAVEPEAEAPEPPPRVSRHHRWI